MAATLFTDIYQVLVLGKKYLIIFLLFPNMKFVVIS